MDRISSRVNITALIDRYQNLVFSICYHMTKDYFASEDLTQETFLSAFRNLSGFDGSNEKAWICRIASNKCVDYLKAAERRAVPVLEEEMEIPCTTDGIPEKEALEKEVREELLSCCRQLKPPYDKTAVMFFYEEKKPQEIAAATGEKIKTVQTRISRARQMLRKLYAKGGIGP